MLKYQIYMNKQMKLKRLLVIRLKVNSSFPFIYRVNLKSSLPSNRSLRIDIDINVVDAHSFSCIPGYFSPSAYLGSLSE